MPFRSPQHVAGAVAPSARGDHAVCILPEITRNVNDPPSAIDHDFTRRRRQFLRLPPLDVRATETPLARKLTLYFCGRRRGGGGSLCATAVLLRARGLRAVALPGRLVGLNASREQESAKGGLPE